MRHIGRQRLRVLIAEDDENVRAVLAELISSDAELELVGVVTDTDSAIAATTAELPDVVVLDMRMPGGGGVVAAGAIRRISPRSRVIAFSGHAAGPTEAAMRAAGVEAYVPKGSPIADILASIHRVAQDGLA